MDRYCFSLSRCIYISTVGADPPRQSSVFENLVYAGQIIILHRWWVSTQDENGGSLIFSKNEGSFLIFQIGFLDTRNERSL
mgnify:FL=1